jgi:hypothetical protein
LAYSLDWHTGFPFNIVNQTQQLVGKPDSARFPDFFTLNGAVERKFTLKNYLLALRIGMDDLTGRRNPYIVQNNIDAPDFMTFSAYRGRTFNGRIRFLGKK